MVHLLYWVVFVWIKPGNDSLVILSFISCEGKNEMGIKDSMKERNIRKCRILAIMAALLLIAVLTAGACFAADNKDDPKDELTIVGKYKDVTARVVVKITDPEVMKVRDKDYIDYLSEAELGDELTVPMETKDDFIHMKMNATCEAMEENKTTVQINKAKRHDSKLMKKAERDAAKKAKAKYDAIWNQPSEKMSLPTATDGSTKTYMDYKTVTDTSTFQYALLNNKKAETKDGFRMYDGYYCIALGSYYGRAIGTKYYITLSNGRTLRCILGDQKQDRHTDEKNMYALKNKDIVEFVVDDIDLPGGDVSAVKGFEGSVVSIKRILEPEIIDFNGVKMRPPANFEIKPEKEKDKDKDKKSKNKTKFKKSDNDKDEDQKNKSEVTKPDKNKQDNKETEKTETEVDKQENDADDSQKEPEKPDPAPADQDKEGT